MTSDICTGTTGAWSFAQGYQYLETLVLVLSKFGIGIGIDQYLIAYIGIDQNTL